MKLFLHFSWDKDSCVEPKRPQSIDLVVLPRFRHVQMHDSVNVSSFYSENFNGKINYQMVKLDSTVEEVRDTCLFESLPTV